MIRAALTAAILTCALLLPLSAQARDHVLNIQEVTTPKGLKLWLVEDHTIPVLAVDFGFLGAGAAQDPADKQGLAQLASNTLDEGAGDLDSQTFQKTLSDLSISLGFESSRDDFGGSLKTLSRNRDKALDLLRLTLTAPRFDAEPLQRMKDANLSRIRESQGDPDWITARILNDRAFAGHPYARNAGGTLSSLPTLTADDLRHFLKSRLSRANLRIAMAGDITPQDAARLADKTFGDLPEKTDLQPVPPLTLQNAGSVALYEMDVPQTSIHITQPGIALDDPDYFTAQMAVFILGGGGFGSRLTEEIREQRGLTYGIDAGLNRLDAIATLDVSTSTANASAAQVLDLIRAEWTKMKAAPPTAAELDSARTYLIGSLPLSLSSTNRISGLLLGLQMDGRPIDWLDRRAAALKAVTAQDVHRVAQRLLDEKAFVTVLVGKPETVKPTLTIKDLPNVQ